MSLFFLRPRGENRSAMQALACIAGVRILRARRRELAHKSREQKYSRKARNSPTSENLLERAFEFRFSHGRESLRNASISLHCRSSHFASKAAGARSQEPRAKIFAQSAKFSHSLIAHCNRSAFFVFRGQKHAMSTVFLTRDFRKTCSSNSRERPPERREQAPEPSGNRGAEAPRFHQQKCRSRQR